METIEGMPLLSCVVDVEVKETKRKERERSLGKFSQDQEDTRRCWDTFFDLVDSPSP